ncbi:CotH kinase family protein [Treponema sp.]|uniref:CotH kinase family protein n=1 Tax=Treponema sp. TaxID=166 RepID=UPI003F02FD70
MRLVSGIKRYSCFFYLALFLLASSSFFVFLVSSNSKVTFEQCEKLGLPILEITTENYKSVKSKEKYINASYEFSGAENLGGNHSGKCKIRGHGNSTWNTTFTQKRPYLLKLSSPAELLGLPAAAKWILMANACDRAMLRNYYAEYLTHNVWDRMRWNPSSKYITLFLNGKYLGLYGLTEKVEVEKNRVEFEGEGFLAEIDSHEGRPYKFISNSGIRFNIRSPKSSQENYEKWAAKIQSLEDVLYSEEWKGGEGYKKYFDMDSFVDWYLLAEFSKNYDAKFYNSVFMNYDYKTEKLYMGPSWDHDIAFGNSAKSSTFSSVYGSPMSSNAWINLFYFFDPLKNSTAAGDYDGFLINQSHWYNRLFADEEFVALVKDRWQEKRKELWDSIEWLRKQGEALDAAAELNDSVWHILGSAAWPRVPGYRKRKTYKSEVDFLVEWCEKRFLWLDFILR